MKIKFVLVILMVFSQFLFSQEKVIVDKYPFGHFFYEKGELNFLKELQEVAKKNDIKPCENKNEEYHAKWIVYPDNTIKFIKDSDSINISKNKCAYDFYRETFKHLDGWIPFIHNGQSYAVVAEYNIVPNDIFRYKINNDLKREFVEAEYRGGVGRFQSEVTKLLEPIIQKNIDYVANQKFYINFKINKEGKIIDVKVPDNITFVITDEIINKISGMPKWKPATMNGIEVETRVRLPIIVTR